MRIKPTLSTKFASPASPPGAAAFAITPPAQAQSVPAFTELRRPIVELLILAAPTVAQMVSYTGMQFIDTWLLSYTSDRAPTAAANSGMMALSVLGFGMGVMWIVNTLASQHFGRGDFASCGRYLWQGIWFALGYWLLTLLALPWSGTMFRAFGHPADITVMETRYFHILLAAAGVKLISTALGQLLLAINHPGSVLVAAVVAMSVNALAAWVLVLGHAGAPAMGIAGAAWAQNIGVVCEMLVLVLFIVQPPLARRYNLFDWRLRWANMRTLLRIGLPSGVQFVGDILAWTLFINLVIGLLGPVAMAANTYMLRYWTLSFMPAIGLSTAVTALVGRYIGRGQPEIARQRTHLAFILAGCYMVACGMVFYFGRHQLLRVFTSDPAVLKIGAQYLTFAAIYQLFDAMYVIYNGALRGAGDTFVPAVLTATLCWGMTVGGGYIMARYFPQVGPGGPWFIATAYGILLGALISVRFARGKWKQIQIDGAGGD